MPTELRTKSLTAKERQLLSAVFVTESGVRRDDHRKLKDVLTSVGVKCTLGDGEVRVLVDTACSLVASSRPVVDVSRGNKYGAPSGGHLPPQRSPNAAAEDSTANKGSSPNNNTTKNNAASSPSNGSPPSNSRKTNSPLRSARNQKREALIEALGGKSMGGTAAPYSSSSPPASIVVRSRDTSPLRAATSTKRRLQFEQQGGGGGDSPPLAKASSVNNANQQQQHGQEGNPLLASGEAAAVGADGTRSRGSSQPPNFNTSTSSSSNHNAHIASSALAAREAAEEVAAQQAMRHHEALLGPANRMLLLQEFILFVDLLKQQYVQRVTASDADVLEAFMSVGGCEDTSGDVSADMLKGRFRDIKLAVDIDRLIAEVDEDGSGKIEYGEFFTLMTNSHMSACVVPADSILLAKVGQRSAPTANTASSPSPPRITAVAEKKVTVVAHPTATSPADPLPPAVSSAPKPIVAAAAESSPQSAVVTPVDPDGGAGGAPPPCAASSGVVGVVPTTADLQEGSVGGFSGGDVVPTPNAGSTTMPPAAASVVACSPAVAPDNNNDAPPSMGSEASSAGGKVVGAAAATATETLKGVGVASANAVNQGDADGDEDEEGSERSSAEPSADRGPEMLDPFCFYRRLGGDPDDEEHQYLPKAQILANLPHIGLNDDELRNYLYYVNKCPLEIFSFAAFMDLVAHVDMGYRAFNEGEGDGSGADGSPSGGGGGGSGMEGLSQLLAGVKGLSKGGAKGSTAGRQRGSGGGGSGDGGSLIGSGPTGDQEERSALASALATFEGCLDRLPDSLLAGLGGGPASSHYFTHKGCTLPPSILHCLGLNVSHLTWFVNYFKRRQSHQLTNSFTDRVARCVEELLHELFKHRGTCAACYADVAKASKGASVTERLLKDASHRKNNSNTNKSVLATGWSSGRAGGVDGTTTSINSVYSAVVMDDGYVPFTVPAPSMVQPSSWRAGTRGISERNRRQDAFLSGKIAVPSTPMKMRVAVAPAASQHDDDYDDDGGTRTSAAAGMSPSPPSVPQQSPRSAKRKRPQPSRGGGGGGGDVATPRTPSSKDSPRRGNGTATTTTVSVLSIPQHVAARYPCVVADESLIGVHVSSISGRPNPRLAAVSAKFMPVPDCNAIAMRVFHKGRTHKQATLLAGAAADSPQHQQQQKRGGSIAAGNSYHNGAGASGGGGGGGIAHMYASPSSTSRSRRLSTVASNAVSSASPSAAGAAASPSPPSAVAVKAVVPAKHSGEWYGGGGSISPRRVSAKPSPPSLPPASPTGQSVARGTGRPAVSNRDGGDAVSAASQSARGRAAGSGGLFPPLTAR